MGHPASERVSPYSVPVIPGIDQEISGHVGQKTRTTGLLRGRPLHDSSNLLCAQLYQSHSESTICSLSKKELRVERLTETLAPQLPD